SRRIDNQLRGRSGRQGDPGRSKFFLSLEDDLMRIFGSDRLDTMLTRLGLQEGEAIIHPWINKALEKAQQKVEARNFELRKNELKRVLDLDLPVDQWAKEEGIADEELLSRVEKRADEHMAAKVAQWGPEVIRYVEKTLLLQTLDHLWREHLVMLEHLRQVIGLRGYGQRDPLNEYKSESFHLFEAMIQRLREAVTAQLMRVEIVSQPPAEESPRGDEPPERPLPFGPSPTLPFMEAHKVDPLTGEDEMALADAPAGA